MDLPVIETQVFSLAPGEENAELTDLFSGGPISGITRALESAKEGDVRYLTMVTAILAILAAAFWMAYFFRKSRYNRKKRQLDEVNMRKERRKRWDEEEKKYREEQDSSYDGLDEYDDSDKSSDAYSIDDDLEKWASDDK